LLEFDNVANDQRTIIYRQRNELMASDDVEELVKDMRMEVVEQLVDDYIPPQSVAEQWDIPGLEEAVETEFALKLPIQQWLDEDDQLFEEQLKQKIVEHQTEAYEAKSIGVGDKMRLFEKQIMLQILDGLWKDHLATMDQLRQGIFLRSYSGKNPKQEYKREAFALFQELLANLQREVIKVLSHVKVRQEDDADAIERQREQERSKATMQFMHQAASALSRENSEDADGDPAAAQAAQGVAPAPKQPFVREDKKVGRNEPCPCGSGKKYKLCHGKLG